MYENIVVAPNRDQILRYIATETKSYTFVVQISYLPITTLTIYTSLYNVTRKISNVLTFQHRTNLFKVSLSRVYLLINFNYCSHGYLPSTEYKLAK